MRSRFRFRFSCANCQFSGQPDISFFATGDPPSRGTPAPSLERAKIDFRLGPEKSSRDRTVSGSIFVTVPGSPDESEMLARMLAGDLVEHLGFFYPGFRLLGGLLSAERIAETPEEATAIAVGPYWANVTLEEVQPPPEFDSELLKLFPYSRKLTVPVAQFNAAALATNPVDGFLSAINVFEYLYHRQGISFAQSLQQATELRSAVATCLAVRKDDEDVLHPVPEKDIDQFLSDLADTRNRCAHLRDSGGYGYTPRHAEVFTVVQPRLEFVRTLARHILRSRMITARTAGRIASGLDEPADG